MSFLASLSLMATCALSPSVSATPAVAPTPVLSDSYAIVASKSVANDPTWRAETIEKLQKKYPNAKLFVWERRLEDVLPQLSAMQPSFTAYITRPEETTDHYVFALHVFNRSFDEDPYVDTFWGIITGYDAPSAGLLAAAEEIKIAHALDCSGVDLKPFDEAWRYSEDHRGTMKYWKHGVTPDVESNPCDTDNTQDVLTRLQKDNVQFLSTSGHATEHDWQMGYCGPNMQLRHKEGRLVAIDTKEKQWPAASTEPKVYLANGNCLIGHIDTLDCMALSWMRDGGVRQMMGYIVTTWFGAQGWGTLGLFVDHAGLSSANEAFHFTNTGIIKTIQDYNIPDMMDYRWTQVNHYNMPMTQGMVNWGNAEFDKDRSPTNQARLHEKIKQMAGNLHDRDCVAFYGDPALKTSFVHPRITVHAPALVGNEMTLSFSVHEGIRADVPVWLRLPGSWTYGEVKADAPLATPTLAIDNMLYFPKQTLEPGKTYTVKLTGVTRKGN